MAVFTFLLCRLRQHSLLVHIWITYAVKICLVSIQEQPFMSLVVIFGAVGSLSFLLRFWPFCKRYAAQSQTWTSREKKGLYSLRYALLFVYWREQVCLYRDSQVCISEWTWRRLLKRLGWLRPIHLSPGYTMQSTYLVSIVWVSLLKTQTFLLLMETHTSRASF